MNKGKSIKMESTGCGTMRRRERGRETEIGGKVGERGKRKGESGKGKGREREFCNAKINDKMFNLVILESFGNFRNISYENNTNI